MQRLRPGGCPLRTKAKSKVRRPAPCRLPRIGITSRQQGSHPTGEDVSHWMRAKRRTIPFRILASVPFRVCQLFVPPYKHLGTFGHSQPHATITTKLFCFSGSIENKRVFESECLLGRRSPRFKSGRPDHQPTELTDFLFRDTSATLQLGTFGNNCSSRRFTASFCSLLKGWMLQPALLNSRLNSTSAAAATKTLGRFRLQLRTWHRRLQLGRTAGICFRLLSGRTKRHIGRSRRIVNVIESRHEVDFGAAELGLEGGEVLPGWSGSFGGAMPRGPYHSWPRALALRMISK